MSLSTRELRRLTHEPLNGMYPDVVARWPASIAFMSWRNGRTEIFTAKADGSGPADARVTMPTGDAVDPRWSPDGELHRVRARARAAACTEHATADQQRIVYIVDVRTRTAHSSVEQMRSQTVQKSAVEVSSNSTTGLPAQCAARCGRRSAAAAPVRAVAAARPRRRPGRPKSNEFVFARLRYDSGDWDYNPKVAGNVLDSVVQYTTIPVYPEEIVITADSPELLVVPVSVHDGPQARALQREASARDSSGSSSSGGLLFSDDCNHDVDGLYAKSFEEEMRRTFPGRAARWRRSRPRIALYRVVLRIRRPAADLARAQRLGRRHGARLPARHRAQRPPRRDLLEQGLRLRVGLRLAEQAVQDGGQHEVRGESGRLLHDVGSRGSGFLGSGFAGRVPGFAESGTGARVCVPGTGSWQYSDPGA